MAEPADTVAEVVAGVLSLATVILARWTSHVHGRVNQLRERVARLEQRDEDRDDPPRH